jgi:hypothetical protein
MTLDEDGTQAFQNLKACTEAAQVRRVPGTMLTASCLSDTGQKAFWQSLNHELNVLLHELQRPSEQAAGGDFARSSRRHRRPLRNASERSRAMTRSQRSGCATCLAFLGSLAALCANNH